LLISKENGQGVDMSELFNDFTEIKRFSTISASVVVANLLQPLHSIAYTFIDFKCKQYTA
jgi:hypothetical protein